MIARKYIAIPGTSVPAEWLFSKVGEIVSARRANINSKKLGYGSFTEQKLALLIFLFFWLKK